MTNEKKIVQYSDFSLIIGDFTIGLLVGKWFDDIFFSTSATFGEQRAFVFFCIFMLLIFIAYSVGLLINQSNVDNLPSRNYSTGEVIALAFNSVLASMVLTETIKGATGLNNMAVYIILIFSTMGYWFWLHHKLLNIAHKALPGNVNAKKQIIGIACILPLGIFCLLPVNAIINAYIEAGDIYSSNLTIGMMISTSAVLALSSWMLIYIPRRMIRILSGSTYRNRFFMLYLFGSIFIRILLFA